MLSIAHRGASADAPENTIEAFELAVEQGADMIETDLHLSSDGQVPLYHDDELGGVAVGELSLAEIRARHRAVPTLEEALDAVGDQIPFNLEIKRGRENDYRGLDERVLRTLRSRGLLERTLFSAFYDSALVSLRKAEPLARIGLLVSRRSAIAIEERALRLGAEAVHPEHSITTPELVASLHDSGLAVHVFTVDDLEAQRQLIDWGVDGIFTNRPAQLRALVAQ